VVDLKEASLSLVQAAEYMGLKINEDQIAWSLGKVQSHLP
jgi:hypothetical protein